MPVYFPGVYWFSFEKKIKTSRPLPISISSLTSGAESWLVAIAYLFENVQNFFFVLLSFVGSNVPKGKPVHFLDEKFASQNLWDLSGYQSFFPINQNTKGPWRMFEPDRCCRFWPFSASTYVCWLVRVAVFCQLSCLLSCLDFSSIETAFCTKMLVDSFLESQSALP